MNETRSMGYGRHENILADHGWGKLPERQNSNIQFEEWIKNLSPADLVVVHVTNTFPSDKTVRSHVGSGLEKNEKPMNVYSRDTIHFVLNGTVQESHGIKASGSNWKNRNFVVIAPLVGVNKEEILNVKTDDTFIVGDFEIPSGSKVLVDWRELNKLSESGLITGEEAMTILAEIGVNENYVKTSNIPERTAKITKNGVEYLICDLSGNNLREIINGEISSMGFKPMSIGEHGWDNDLKKSDVVKKYELPENMQLHDDTLSSSIEKLGGRLANFPRSFTNNLIDRLSDTDVSDEFCASVIEEYKKHITYLVERTKNIPDQHNRAKESINNKLIPVLNRAFYRMQVLASDNYPLEPHVKKQLAELGQWLDEFRAQVPSDSLPEEGIIEYFALFDTEYSYRHDCFIKNIYGEEYQDSAKFSAYGVKHLFEQYLPVINANLVSVEEREKAKVFFGSILADLKKELEDKIKFYRPSIDINSVEEIEKLIVNVLDQQKKYGLN